MVAYFKAYLLETLQEFDQWNEKDNNTANEKNIAYIRNDFMVFYDPFDAKSVLHTTISKDWQKFCQETLHYEEHTNTLPPIEVENETKEPLPHQNIPFTSAQRWLIEECTSTHPLFANLSAILRIKIDFYHLLEIFTYLIHYHDAFRIKLRRDAQRWYQFLDEAPSSLPLTWICLANIPVDLHKQIISDLFLCVTKHINTFRDYLCHTTYFHIDGDNAGYLLATYNHMIIDGFSLHILSKDFQSLYAQVIQREKLTLPPKTASFEECARARNEYIQSQEMEDEIDQYWSKLPWDQVKQLPMDFPTNRYFDTSSSRWGYGTYASVHSIEDALSISETQNLLFNAVDKQIQIMDLLLTAMGFSFVQWTKEPLFYIFVEDNARTNHIKGIDLLRTIGDITTSRRILLNIGAVAKADEALFSVHEQLQATPNNALSLEWLLRRGDNQPVLESLHSLPFADVFLNYHGLVVPSEHNDCMLPKIHYPLSYRNHMLNCLISVVDNKMHFIWEYSYSIHYKETIEKLSNSFMHALRQLIEFRCTGKNSFLIERRKKRKDIVSHDSGNGSSL